VARCARFPRARHVSKRRPEEQAEGRPIEIPFTSVARVAALAPVDRSLTIF
jgi:hypothetical protein